MVRKLFQEQCVLMNQIVWEKSKNWQLGIKIKIGNNINIPPEINDELNTIDGYIKEKWLIFEDRTITSNDPINQIEEAFLHIIDQILYLELLFEDNENHNKKTIK